MQNKRLYKEEVIGKSSSILRDINNHSTLFENMWETIKDKKYGMEHFSNLKRTSEAYYLNMTIVPLLDTNQEIKEFISLMKMLLKKWFIKKN